MNELRRLKPGMKVSDVGYQPVGEVQTVSDDSFELDVNDDGTVTLSEEALLYVGDGSATLVCNADGIEKYET